MSKRLELIWPNKKKVTLGLDEDGKPIWGTKVSRQPLCSCQSKLLPSLLQDPVINSVFLSIALFLKYCCILLAD